MTPRRSLSFDGLPIDPATVLRTARITDHALVRWLERIEGYPVEGLRRAILCNPAVLQALALGASGLQLPELGARLVISERRIVTITALAQGEDHG